MRQTKQSSAPGAFVGKSGGTTDPLALGELTDVTTTGNAPGDLLRLDSDGEWKPAHVTISESAPVAAPGSLDVIWYVLDPL